MLREEHEKDLYFSRITRNMFYTDSNSNRFTVSNAVEQRVCRNTRPILLRLLPARHNFGNGMPDGHTSLLCLLLR